MAYIDNYDLALNENFQKRVTMAAVYAAKVVAAEAVGVTNHNNRAMFATRLLNDPIGHTLCISLAITAGPAITKENVTDALILTEVQNAWNGLSGVL
jgi:uncharacterized membrane protein